MGCIGQFGARHARHLNVGQQDADLIVEQGKGGSAAISFHNVMPVIAQGICRHLTDPAVIIDDQNLHAIAPTARPASAKRASTVSICSGVCSAQSEQRSRKMPVGVAGGRAMFT